MHSNHVHMCTLYSMVTTLWQCSTGISTPNGNCSDGQLRLEGGSDDVVQETREGRVEICINNAWGTVCRTLFGNPDAQVACHELGGFYREGKADILSVK